MIRHIRNVLRPEEVAHLVELAKSVRFVEHEGRPRAIEFSCSCGETSLVELVFEEQPATGKAGVKS
mgnify:CR=1 FL=1